jgi:hypothetical protein
VLATVSGCGPVAALGPTRETSREYMMSGIPRWALIRLGWLSSCRRRWLSASRCDQSLEMLRGLEGSKTQAWMACRVITVNTNESYRAASNGQWVAR